MSSLQEIQSPQIYLDENEYSSLTRPFKFIKKLILLNRNIYYVWLSVIGLIWKVRNQLNAIVINMLRFFRHLSLRSLRSLIWSFVYLLTHLIFLIIIRFIFVLFWCFYSRVFFLLRILFLSFTWWNLQLIIIEKFSVYILRLC